MKEINIIIPTYNEKENILSLIKSIKKFIPKATIIIVDDTPKNDIGILINKNKITKVQYFHRKIQKVEAQLFYMVLKNLEIIKAKYLLKWMQISLIHLQS